MAAYIARRLLLMIPTILGILLISFVIVQFAPGGPVERVLAQLQGLDQSTSGRIGAGANDLGSSLQARAAIRVCQPPASPPATGRPACWPATRPWPTSPGAPSSPPPR